MPRKTFKKQITTDELISQISPDNAKLIRLFIKDKDRKCSDLTIKGYTSDLNIFFCWNVLNNGNKFYAEVKKSELSDFFSYCIDELKWKGKRFSRVKSVFSGLSDIVIKYYDDEYPMFRNFVNSVVDSIPKPPVRDKTILTIEEIDLLLKYLKDNNFIQEACFLALAIYSGCRISELEQFTIESINIESTSFGGVMLETTHTLRCKGFGKEGHVINKNIIKDLFLPYYKAWLIERDKIIIRTGSLDTSLFLKNNGVKATQNVFRRWFARWETVIDKPMYCHAFRHYFVTMLTKLNLSSDYIVALIGWRDSKMLVIYNDMTDKDREWKDSEKLQKIIEDGNQ